MSWQVEYDATFDVTIHTKTPNSFSYALDRNIINALNLEYSGKCKNGTFITKIIGPLSRSLLLAEQLNNDAMFYADVQFAAKVISIEKGDIICGVRAIVRNTLIMGTYRGENYTIGITLNLPPTVVKGIPADGIDIDVIVEEVKHEPKSEQINVIAIPLKMFKSSRQIFHILPAAPGTTAMPSITLTYLEKIKEEYEKVKAISKEKLQEINKKLYSTEKSAHIDIGEITSILDLSPQKLAGAHVALVNIIYEPNIILIKKPKDIPTIKVNLAQFYTNFLRRCLNHLMLVNNMAAREKIILYTPNI